MQGQVLRGKRWGRRAAVLLCPTAAAAAYSRRLPGHIDLLPRASAAPRKNYWASTPGQGRLPLSLARLACAVAITTLGPLLRLLQIYMAKYAKPGMGIGHEGARQLVEACRAAGLKTAVASSADLVKVGDSWRQLAPGAGAGIAQGGACTGAPAAGRYVPCSEQSQ